MNKRASQLSCTFPVRHHGDILFSLSGIAGGLLAGYILFQAIYIIVPNQKISFRNSWLGSVVAAVLLELYLTFRAECSTDSFGHFSHFGLGSLSRTFIKGSYRSLEDCSVRYDVLFGA